ncbi:MAG: DUF4178 domain-containing protein [Bacteroidota bacterium]
MFSREFECPSCGAPVPQSHPGSRTLVCNHCGQTSHVNADSLAAVGSKNLLIDYGSALAVGRQGRIEERDFLILGKMRIDYEDGFWDEWFIQFLDDGSVGWIQEDDGSFTLFREEKKLGSPPNFDRIKVGSWTDFNGAWDEVFVTSKSRARVNGGEGELPFRIIPGEPADFIDGLWKRQVMSLEVLPDETVLFSGRVFDLAELEIS